MGRPKGVPNKKTIAALQATRDGTLIGRGMNPLTYMAKVMRDSDRPVELRLEAAKSLAPYVHPRLSNVEQTVIDPRDARSEADILAELRALLAADPTLLAKLAPAPAEVADTPENVVRLAR